MVCSVFPAVFVAVFIIWPAKLSQTTTKTLLKSTTNHWTTKSKTVSYGAWQSGLAANRHSETHCAADNPNRRRKTAPTILSCGQSRVQPFIRGYFRVQPSQRSRITPNNASLKMPPLIFDVPSRLFTNITGTSFILKPIL